MSATTRAWWKEVVIYQIYPPSFLDSNGDGWGDLNGITSKLDYLKDLGVDVVWLSPIYKSPMADMGYDVSDYENIDPSFGTLNDWDNLLKSCHDRGIKLMMDLVVNHSSDEHQWFVQSRSSKTNPKRDWYIWRPPKYDDNGRRLPPNNWRSNFGGSVWEYDEQSEEYYLHLYGVKQPDLNWDNPQVRQRVFQMMRFWLDRGCDGFRMDTINLLSKTPGLPDAPITQPEEQYQLATKLFANGPRIHEYLSQMNQEVTSKYDMISVGEMSGSTHQGDIVASYVLPSRKELQMAFQFEVVHVDATIRGNGEVVSYLPKPWDLREIKEITGRWQKFKRDEGYWNTIFIENHDIARSVSRFGNDEDEWRATSAKMIALLQIGLGGTLFVFQGQELGLKNIPKNWSIDEYKDVSGKNYYKGILARRQEEQGSENVDMSDILSGLQRKARDNGRLPMQWDGSPNAGFSSTKPWMRVNDDYKEWNAALQVDDPGSIFSFYKKAIQIRKKSLALIYGEFQDISLDHPDVFAFLRTLGDQVMLIILNFRKEGTEFQLDLGKYSGAKWELVLSNVGQEGNFGGTHLTLRGYEARLYTLVAV